MNMRYRTPWVLGLLVALCLNGLPLQGGETVVELKTEELKNAKYMIGRSEYAPHKQGLRAGAWSTDAWEILNPFNYFFISYGIVLPSTAGVFPKKDPITSFDIGELPCKMDLTGKAKLIAGDKTYKVKTKDQGLKNIKLSLPDGRKYCLAFPFYSSSNASIFYYRPGSAQVGEVDKNEFMIYDDNRDTYFQIQTDGFTLEDGLVMAPLTKYLPVGPSIYEITKLNEEGESVTLNPYTGDSAEVMIEFNGAQKSNLAHFAFQPTTAEKAKLIQERDAPAASITYTTSTLPPDMDDEREETDRMNKYEPYEEGMTFVTTPKVNTVKVLPGMYQMLYGLVYDKKEKYVAAGIVADDEPVIDIAAGETKKIKMGGPFHISFAATVSGTKIMIQNTSFQLHGKNGERYICFRFVSGGQICIRPRGEKKEIPIGRMSVSGGYLWDFTGEIPVDKKGNRLRGPHVVTGKFPLECFGLVEASCEIDL